MQDKGDHVWSGDLLDGSRVEFRLQGGKLVKYDRVFNSRTGQPEPDMVKDAGFNEPTGGLIHQLLKKLTRVEHDYTAYLWKDG